MNLPEQFKKAQYSPFRLWLLNNALQIAIPFNRQHSLRILKIYDNGVEILLPYKRKNMNHLGGLHACALGALCEYSCGITLARLLPQNKYRLIMKELNLDFHYQAKTGATVKFTVDNSFVEQNIIEPLTATEKVLVIFSVEAFDTGKNHLCTANVLWQIKRWDKVKTV